MDVTLPDRIVVVNDSAIVRGGAAALALASVRGFRQRGLPVTFVCGDKGENAELGALGVPVLALGEEKLLEGAFSQVVLRGLYNPRTVRVVSDWIARNDTARTVYHLHTWYQILSPSVFAALDPVRDRLVITAHDYFLACPNGAYVTFGDGKPCRLRPLGTRCLATSCDRRSYTHKLWRVARQTVQSRLLAYRGGHPRVLAIHDAMRPELERGGVPADAMRTLTNPITPWQSERIRAEENAEFVFVGRLDEEKGADLAAMAARRAGATLRIVGDGPMLDELRLRFPEVIFSGRQPPSVVADLVKSARALMMPSRYPEPFGLVAVEALWSGLPVIVAETALIAPDVVASGAGIACNPRDEAALAGAMTLMLQDDDATRRMSVAAFDRTRGMAMTPDTWIDALLGAYREVLGTAGDPTSPPWPGLDRPSPERQDIASALVRT